MCEIEASKLFFRCVVFIFTFSAWLSDELDVVRRVAYRVTEVTGLSAEMKPVMSHSEDLQVKCTYFQGACASIVARAPDRTSLNLLVVEHYTHI